MRETALVIGMGITGKGVTEFLLARGYKAICVDRKDLRGDPEIMRLVSLGAELFSEEDFPFDIDCAFAVCSPGIGPDHPIVRFARARGIPVEGELPLVLRHNRHFTVGITGTNGKTTVTSLIEHILVSSGRRAKAIGNIGFSAAAYFLNPDPEEILVVELSSYQLETMQGPFLDAAVLLNITADHLDRYENFTKYAEAKARIALCLKEGGRLYLGPSVCAQFPRLIQVPFVSIEEAEERFRLESMPDHERENTLAAFAVCRQAGVSSEDCFRSLASFTKPPHRIQFISEVRGVSYYDDSKGTNVDATVQAVRSMKGSVVLIAGGVDKGASYFPWKEPFSGKVKQIFAVGQAAPKIYRELSLFFNVKIVDSLECAVLAASKAACEGDAVLLSPGCSSFDMFDDYVHRGREFQKFVGLLAGEGTK